MKLDSEGRFRVEVAPGQYSLQVSDCVFLGCAQSLPRTVTVEAGETTDVEISIDTGIR